MYDSPQYPMPPLRRAMVFIDGENLAIRYKEMIKKGKKPLDNVRHLPETFVWNPATLMPDFHLILRAIYYTYVQRDEYKVVETSNFIRDTGFRQYRPLNQPHVVVGTNSLYAKVYKKGRNSRGKGVDIQMTVDILTNTYQDNMDSVFLFSGDGDYKPVIEECISLGKQAYVRAFSSGLNETLKHTADHFQWLDDWYFREDIP